MGSNRIGHLYGQGLYPLDECGMEAVPTLGRDEPEPETKRALLNLRRRWFEARKIMKWTLGLVVASETDPEAPDSESWRRFVMLTRAAADVADIEDQAAALALWSAGVTLLDELLPTDGFPPVSVDLGAGRRVQVAPAVPIATDPGGYGRRRVSFT